MVRHGVGEAPGHEDEVEQGQQAPHGAEEQKVDFGGGSDVPVARPPVCDCACVSVGGDGGAVPRVLGGARRVGGYWKGGLWNGEKQTVGGQSEDDDGEDSLRDAQPQHDDAGLESGHGGAERRQTELLLLRVSNEQQWEVTVPTTTSAENATKVVQWGR